MGSRFLPLLISVGLSIPSPAWVEAEEIPATPADTVVRDTTVEAPSESAAPSQDLLSPPSAAWGSIRDHLLAQGVDLDSMSAVGIVLDRSTRDVLVVTLQPDGTLAKVRITTPRGFYESLVGTAEPDSTSRPPVDAHRQDGRAYFVVITTLRSTALFPTSLALALPHTDGRGSRRCHEHPLHCPRPRPSSLYGPRCCRCLGRPAPG